ncbi:hypothetical protein BDR26DRAFT_817957 [Obelidium mucronatum]|nr:hypothetical protein BDR26DRAFT_817957 [Obelidium mucronatum]
MIPSQTPTLAAAAASGDTESLMRMLGLKRSASSESITGTVGSPLLVNTVPSPLLAAAARGHLDAVVLLVDRGGALVDFSDSDGETALLKAAFYGHFAVVCFLTSRGAFVDHRDKDGWSALHNSASGGFGDVCGYLLEKGDSADKVNKAGFTALMNAASKGHTHIVQLLLSNHSSTIQLNKYGDTAFSLAAQSEHLDVCEILAQSSIYSVHCAEVEIVYETQSSTLFHPNVFSPTGLYHKGSFHQTYSGPILSLKDIKLPAAEAEPLTIQQGDPFPLTATAGKWFWLTDWRIDDACIISTHDSDSHCDEDGWRYSKSLDDKDPWFSTPSEVQKRSTFGAGGLVRRRRWFRVRKRKMNVVLKQAEANVFRRVVEPVDYVTRAAAILTNPESIEENQDVGNLLVRWRAELTRYEGAIQILLSGIKADNDAIRRNDATEKATALLFQAELLAEKMSSMQKQRNTPGHGGFAGATVTPREKSISDDREESLPKQHPSVLSEETSEPAETEQIESSDWKASVLASAGWKLDGRSLEIDSNSPVASNLPLSIQDPQGQRWTSNDAIVYTEDVFDDDSDEVQPVRDQDSPRLSPFDDQNTTDSEDDELSYHPAAPNSQPQSESPRITNLLNLRPGISFKTPLAPKTTTAVMAQRDPVLEPSSPIVKLDVRKMSVASISSYESAQEELFNNGESTDEIDVFGLSTSSSPAIAIPQLPIPGDAVDIQISSPGSVNSHGNNTVPAGVILSSSAGSSFVGTIRNRSPVGSWQSSETAINCRQCRRKFSLFLRKRHCRWCGFVFCDACSNHRVALSNGTEPAASTSVPQQQSQGEFHRVCDTCYSFLTDTTDSPLYTNPMTRPSPPAHLSNINQHDHLFGSSSSSSSALDLIASLSHQITTAFTNVVAAGITTGAQLGQQNEEENETDGDDLLTPSTAGSTIPKRNMSDSLMLECPVCQHSLLKMKTAGEAEAHVAECLTRSSPEISGNRYIVQTLKESVDAECVICFNDMVEGERVARLNCLCIYHEACIKSWFKKKSSCPVHYK